MHAPEDSDAGRADTSDRLPIHIPPSPMAYGSQKPCMLDQGRLRMALYWRLKHVIGHIEGLASCLYYFATLELGLGLVFSCLSMAGAGNGVDVSPCFHVPVWLVNSSLTDLRKYEQYASTASLRASDLDLERRGHEMTWSWLVNCVHESWPCVFRHLAHPAIEFFPGGREAKREPRAQAIANKAHRGPQHQ
jgi:hypothetical protein